MNEEVKFPNLQKLSIVTAMVMLAYSSAAFVHINITPLDIQLPGFLFEIKFSFFTIISVIVIGLAAAGTDWVISGNANLREGPHWIHWILPALTALVIGVPLNEITVGASWWIVFAMGGLLFAGVLAAEFISINQADSLYPLALVSLTVVSMALFLVLAIAVRGAGLRLYMVLSAVVPATALVCGRTLSLRVTTQKWLLPWITSITLIVAETAICLFYLPLKPIQFGLILLGVLYALNSLAGHFLEKEMPARVWIEPGVMFGLFLLLAFIL